MFRPRQAPYSSARTSPERRPAAAPLRLATAVAAAVCAMATVAHAGEPAGESVGCFEAGECPALMEAAKLLAANPVPGEPAAEAASDRRTTPSPQNTTVNTTVNATVARAPSVFGSAPVRTSSPHLAALVSDALRAIETAGDGACGGSTPCTDMPVEWQRVLDETKALPRAAQIARVNAAVDRRIAYASDARRHGKGDYWSSPVETMRANAGDCEDYALLKLWLLARLGISPAELFIVVVDTPRTGKRHAVAAVRLDDETLILDSLRRDIRPDTAIEGYAPVFSASRDALWLHARPVRVELSAVF